MSRKSNGYIQQRHDMLLEVHTYTHSSIAMGRQALRRMLYSLYGPFRSCDVCMFAMNAVHSFKISHDVSTTVCNPSALRTYSQSLPTFTSITYTRQHAVHSSQLRKHISHCGRSEPVFMCCIGCDFWIDFVVMLESYSWFGTCLGYISRFMHSKRCRGTVVEYFKHSMHSKCTNLHR